MHVNGNTTMPQQKPRAGSDAIAAGLRLHKREELATPAWYLSASAQERLPSGETKQRTRRWSLAKTAIGQALVEASAWRASLVPGRTAREIEADAREGIRADRDLLAALIADGIIQPTI